MQGKGSLMSGLEAAIERERGAGDVVDMLRTRDQEMEEVGEMKRDDLTTALPQVGIGKKELATEEGKQEQVQPAMEQQQQQQQQQMAEGAPEEDLMWLVPRVVYPQLKSQLASPSMSVRQEHLMLLRTLVLQCPDKFPDLVTLTSPQDPEIDFYLNVAHVQLHRRSRALVRMGRLADAMAAADQGLPNTGGGAGGVGAVTGGSLRCLLDIAVPLLQVVIGEGGDAKDGRGGHERDQIDADREANVVDAAMGALGAVARALPWHQYDTLLSQFMRTLKVKTTKANIRAVCVILDAFHFPLPHNLEAPVHAEGTAPIVTANATAPAPATAAGPSAPDNSKEREEGDEGSDEEAEDTIAHSEANTAATAANVEAEAAAVQRALLQRVLPIMHRLLVQGGPSPVVRAPVALALVKLLRLLPSEVERTELPRALQGIANLLADRQQRVRDDARHVLVAVAKELGPAYLPYICNVLRAALPDKGFTAHVIGYTLHAVLDALVGKLMTTRKSRHAAAAAAAAAAAGQEAAAAAEPEAGAAAEGNEELEEWAAGPEEEGDGGDDGGAASGALDDAVELALPIIENEIFGEVAEAKEVAQFAMNYKEAKKVRGYESFMLLAAGVTFKTSMEPLLDLVRAHLHRASSPSVRNKLSQLLQHAARGVHANPTAGPTALAVWVHRALAGGLEREEAARERAKADVQGATSAAAEHGGAVRDPVAPVGHIIQSTVSSSGKATKRALSPEDAAALHEYLIMDFALQLLHSSLRRGALSGRSPIILGLLDPLLGLMVRALRCRHSGSVGLALRCLTILVGLPLPSLAQASGAAGKGVTALLKRAPNASHPVALEGFRLLAALLRQCSAYQPTTAQLRFLLSWLFSDRSAEDSSEVGPAFALLRAILGRRLVVPEVYDVMNWVQGLMVRSHSPQVRATCASALLQFLLDYPLGPRRTSEHLTFLASNLSFEHETGRLAVLDMVQQVVSKFPVEVTTANAELFLLPLVMRLVNDPAPKCRAAIAGALRALLAALPTQQHDAFATYCRQWLLGNNSALRRAAAHSLGLLAQVEGKRFGPRLWAGPSVATTTTATTASAPAPSSSHAAAGDGPGKPPVPLAAPVLACLTRAAAASSASDAEGGGEGPLVSGGGAEGEEQLNILWSPLQRCSACSVCGSSRSEARMHQPP
uniref:U3 small nucleolar RNA-associated protein 20 domain-containing protein n=1 Tax=Dunaliella tertiolecta TaxID=3047 RepID=A0A7S3R808_DUNTE